MKEKLKALMERLEQSKLAPLVQFVKFGLVGVSNTAISYAIEMLGYYVVFARVNWPERVRIAVVTAIAFVVSVLNSYYWNICAITIKFSYSNTIFIIVIS